jgi:hypothetical protein
VTASNRLDLTAASTFHAATVRPAVTACWTDAPVGAHTVRRVKIDVLSVPDCPNHAIAVSRIIDALRAADVTEAEITERVVTDDADAHALGMHGSPRSSSTGMTVSSRLKHPRRCHAGSTPQPPASKVPRVSLS